MSSTNRYTIKKIEPEDLDENLLEWMKEVGSFISQTYGNKFDWKNFPILYYIKENRLTICFRNGEPVGAMLARLYPSIFDPSVLILHQDLLYARPGTRAAKLLLDDFIDFGKVNANHIITTMAKWTNIKHGSLVKLGFKELEMKYRLEV